MQDQEAVESMRNSQQNMSDSYDWRQEENEKAKFKNPKIKDLFPVNYNQQRQEFFKRDCKYNPHFCYKTIVSPEVIPIHREHQALAMKILINNKHQGHKLQTLTEAEVLKTIEEYLEGLGLNQYVQVVQEYNCLSRTSITFYSEKAVLKLRTPLEYNRVSLEGVLNHEVGTHILRRLNHKQNCVRKPSEAGKLIQQGLAVLNQMLPEEIPFLFKPALRYMAAIYAQKMSFSEVYRHLQKYMRDKKDCWRQCVRVKRGIGNTEEHGGFYKDQSYLIGAIQILKNRSDIDFRKIYYGKLAPDETLNLTSGVLPPFIDSQEKYKNYLKRLNKIALCNFIE